MQIVKEESALKTAIIYYSRHHENTKKLLDAIAAENEVTLLDATQEREWKLDEYDRIGFASGIYFSKFHKSLLKIAQDNLTDGKKLFFIYTCGTENDKYTNAIKKAAQAHKAEFIGDFGCLGYDTYGPFKLIGGVAKGHPDEKDISAVLDFYSKLG